MGRDLPAGWQVERATRHPGWPACLGPLAVPAGTVRLRPPRLRDGSAWSRARLGSRDYLEAWEPTSFGRWEERNTVSAWLGQWSGLRGQARRGEALPFIITVDGRFAGQLTIGHIVRGALRSAWVGYWVDRGLAGGGVATAAVALVVDHCFGRAGLHRLEATVRPENRASCRVLGKIGFREEGYFQRYLDVAGAWRDHLCCALTAEEVGEGAAATLVRAGRARLP